MCLCLRTKTIMTFDNFIEKLELFLDFLIALGKFLQTVSQAVRDAFVNTGNFFPCDDSELKFH